MYYYASKLTAAALSGGASCSSNNSGSGNFETGLTCHCHEKQRTQQQHSQKICPSTGSNKNSESKHKSPKKRNYEKFPPQKHHPSRHRGNSLPPGGKSKNSATLEHNHLKTNSLPRSTRNKSKVSFLKLLFIVFRNFFS